MARYKRTSSRCYSVSLEEFEPIRWRSSWCKRHEPLSLENLIHAASKCSPDTASAPMSGLQYRGVEIVELAALFVAGGTRPPHKLLADAMRPARMDQQVIYERPALAAVCWVADVQRRLQEDDAGRGRRPAHADPGLRHVEAARQPARQLERTQHDPCLAFGYGFSSLLLRVWWQGCKLTEKVA